MNKKGFTLVELLAVIVILAIILAIAVPRITLLIENSKIEAYKANEKMLLRAAKTYLGVENNNLPTDTLYSIVVQLTDLISNNYISEIKDVKDKTVSCSGYVTIKMNQDGTYQYNPYVQCGSNYSTVGFQTTLLSANKALNTEVLVVAGGGSGGGYGGNDGAGGGGAGGLIYNESYLVTSGNSIPVTVGAGGLGVGGSLGVLGKNGGNSIFGSLTAIGGGGGGTEGGVRVGQPGGSGGGAGGYGVKLGGAGTAGQGNRGGDCTAPGDGGGGGAGASGQNGLTGIGGIGLQFDISGVPTYYAGGGGASGDKRNARGPGGGAGGLGGGGKGQDASATDVPISGTPNTGGGGGAAAGSTVTYGAGTTLVSGSGGSGIVIIRYYGPQKATGGTITTVDGYTIHTFTTVGNSTFTVNAF